MSAARKNLAGARSPRHSLSTLSLLGRSPSDGPRADPSTRPRSSPRLPRPGRCRRRRWWWWQRPTHQNVEGRGGGKYGGASELGGAAAGELGAAEEAGRRRDAGRRRLSGGGAAIWRRHGSDLGLEGLAVLLRTMQPCRVSSQGSQPAAESSSLQSPWAWRRRLSEAYLLRRRRAADGGVGPVRPRRSIKVAVQGIFSDQV
jgi:hypothetical protein